MSDRNHTYNYKDREEHRQGILFGNCFHYSLCSLEVCPKGSIILTVDKSFQAVDSVVMATGAGTQALGNASPFSLCSHACLQAIYNYFT